MSILRDRRAFVATLLDDMYPYSTFYVEDDGRGEALFYKDGLPFLKMKQNGGRCGVKWCLLKPVHAKTESLDWREFVPSKKEVIAYIKEVLGFND